MAGQCAGCGIDTTDGDVSVLGPRTGAWPYGPAATQSGNNGLRCDADAGLWVPPDAKIVSGTATKPNRVVAPADSSTVLLHEVSLTLTAALRSNSLVRFDIHGGYAGFRMATGNWWGVTRFITTFYDGVPSAFSGSEYVASCENNSGGILGVGGPVEAQHGWDVVPAGTVVKVLANYSLDVLAFADNALNGLTWRCPRITMMLMSIPQQ